ncbi:hypothetical protein BV898_14306, partial [Hypsibius exemplaris]
SLTLAFLSTPYRSTPLCRVLDVHVTALTTTFACPTFTSTRPTFRAWAHRLSVNPPYYLFAPSVCSSDFRLALRLPVSPSSTIIVFRLPFGTVRPLPSTRPTVRRLPVDRPSVLRLTAPARPTFRCPIRLPSDLPSTHSILPSAASVYRPTPSVYPSTVPSVYPSDVRPSLRLTCRRVVRIPFVRFFRPTFRLLSDLPSPVRSTRRPSASVVPVRPSVTSVPVRASVRLPVRPSVRLSVLTCRPVFVRTSFVRFFRPTFRLLIRSSVCPFGLPSRPSVVYPSDRPSVQPLSEVQLTKRTAAASSRQARNSAEVTGSGSNLDFFAGSSANRTGRPPHVKRARKKTRGTFASVRTRIPMENPRRAGRAREPTIVGGFDAVPNQICWQVVRKRDAKKGKIHLWMNNFQANLVSVSWLATGKLRRSDYRTATIPTVAAHCFTIRRPGSASLLQCRCTLGASAGGTDFHSDKTSLTEAARKSTSCLVSPSTRISTRKASTTT